MVKKIVGDIVWVALKFRFDSLKLLIFILPISSEVIYAFTVSSLRWLLGRNI